MFFDRELRNPSGCGVVGVMNQKGESFSGELILNSICCMRERGNGLGSGFAGYGIYPEFKDYWCFHIMYYTESAKCVVEDYLKSNFIIVYHEPISVKKVNVVENVPLLWRYFISFRESESVEEDIVHSVMKINRKIDGACIFSSGKNMGIFKGVGDPEVMGEFYKIPEYRGYLWIAHNRFPTNTPGWWGGAHPFGILDWALVHNGEISSYGVNKRYLEGFGYYCTFSTDTEVLVYLFDLLVRKHGLSFDVVANILSAPFWSQIEKIEDESKKEFLKLLRIIYGPALVNGPFAVVIANSHYMIGLNDRTKLRPLVAAKGGDFLYIASEESAIRAISNGLEKVWMPKAGEPVIGKVEG
ncbi:MAG: glutamine amidotransferase family protein [Synergistetes bacterium]|nr:glutamine amidotransferase family protein [Synergistota bacterium]MDW8192798.1 glutamine amidotransferase family protein [Synergistota bacterium]